MKEKKNHIPKVGRTQSFNKNFEQGWLATLNTNIYTYNTVLILITSLWIHSSLQPGI